MKKILIIDDVATVRKTIQKVLAPLNLECLEAGSAEEASGIMETTQLDLITLDLNLPRENGIQWLKRKRAAGLKVPVIIISDSSEAQAELVFGALENGAQDYIQKPELFGNPKTLIDLVNELTSVKKSAASPEQTNRKSINPIGHVPTIIAIGSSTGGPQALWSLLADFSTPCPPICVVQHMPTDFIKTFARSLAKVSKLELVCPNDGDELRPSTLNIVTQNKQFEVINEKGSKLFAKVTSTEKRNGFCPSVDAMFLSLAKAKISSVAVILTGMGADGAQGISELGVTGQTYNMAQSEESCLIYGMPRRAVESGGVHLSGDLKKLRGILDQFSLNYRRARRSIL